MDGTSSTEMVEGGEWPWQRFVTWRIFGDCMSPIYAGKYWTCVDRAATIRRNDIITLGVDDLVQYLRAAGLPLNSGGFVKRFLGVDEEAGCAIVECLKPPMRIRVPLARVLWVHRIVGLAKIKAAAMGLQDDPDRPFQVLNAPRGLAL